MQSKAGVRFRCTAWCDARELLLHSAGDRTVRHNRARWRGPNHPTPPIHLSVPEVEVQRRTSVVYGAVLPLLDGQPQLFRRQVAQRARLELAGAHLQGGSSSSSRSGGRGWAGERQRARTGEGEQAWCPGWIREPPLEPAAAAAAALACGFMSGG